MDLYLVDKNPDVVAAWQEAFAGLEGGLFYAEDILSISI